VSLEIRVPKVKRSVDKDKLIIILTKFDDIESHDRERMGLLDHKEHRDPEESL
jgi:hypothetical protein